MSGKFSLRYDDFHSNVSKSFGVFKDQEYLHDVTLVSDDQNQVTAHKLVLSVSSEYFNNIFKNNKVSNPFLCLEGVSSTDLNYLLDYIYFGEVQVYQGHLDSFLAAAQRFQLEGLQGRGEVQEEESMLEIKPMDPIPAMKEMKKKEREERKKKKSKKIKSEKFKINDDDIAVLIENQSEKLESSDMSKTRELLYENMTENADGSWSCKVCNKQMAGKNSLELHVEIHMEGLSFPCNTCGKVFRKRNSLRFHKSTKRH